MSLNQPLLLSSALVHQVLLSPTTYPYKQVTRSAFPVLKSCGTLGASVLLGCLSWKYRPISRAR
jgi:hypothetical protein